MKVFIRPTCPSPAEYVRLLRLTLEGISGQPAETDQQALRLKTGLSAIASRITEQSSAADIEAALSAAMDVIRKSHAGSVQRALDQVAELKAVLRTMTDTVTFLSESRSTVVHQLTFIERQLEQASELDDIRLLRPRLAECLEAVRQEAARLQEESRTHTEAVRNQMGLSGPAANAPRRLGSLDLATGLPGRESAERLLVEKGEAGKRCSLALFVPERLGFLLQRHGREAESEVLLHLAQHLSKQMPGGSWLYRWTGPAFLAIRVASELESRDEQAWLHIASKNIEQTIQNERRSALVRIGLSCLVKVSDPAKGLRGLMNELDEFVAANTRE